MHSKKTFRCHCLPLSLPLAPPTRQVYVAAIKRVEGRAGLAGPRAGWRTGASDSREAEIRVVNVRVCGDLWELRTQNGILSVRVR